MARTKLPRQRNNLGKDRKNAPVSDMSINTMVDTTAEVLIVTAAGGGLGFR